MSMLSTDYMSYREIEAKIMNLYSYYNGIVNTILPSTGLNFTNSLNVPAGTCDRNSGLIVFSLPKMVELVNSNEFKDIAILYAVVHELSHMDQYWIGEKYANDKEYASYIERANTRRTLEFIYENTPVLEEVYNSKYHDFYELISNEYKNIKTNGYSFDYITPHIVLDEIVKFVSDNQRGYDDFDKISLGIFNYQSLVDGKNGMTNDNFMFPIKGENALDYVSQFRILAEFKKAFGTYKYTCRCFPKDKFMYAQLNVSANDLKKINVVQQIKA